MLHQRKEGRFFSPHGGTSVFINLCQRGTEKRKRRIHFYPCPSPPTFPSPSPSQSPSPSLSSSPSSPSSFSHLSQSKDPLAPLPFSYACVSNHNNSSSQHLLASLWPYALCILLLYQPQNQDTANLRDYLYSYYKIPVLITIQKKCKKERKVY